MKQGQTCVLDGQFGAVTFAVGTDSAIVLLDDDRRMQVPVDRLVFPSSEEVTEMTEMHRRKPLGRRPQCPDCPRKSPMVRIYRRSKGLNKRIGYICEAGHVVLDGTAG